MHGPVRYLVFSAQSPTVVNKEEVKIVKQPICLLQSRMHRWRALSPHQAVSFLLFPWAWIYLFLLSFPSTCADDMVESFELMIRGRSSSSTLLPGSISNPTTHHRGLLPHDRVDLLKKAFDKLASHLRLSLHAPHTHTHTHTLSLSLSLSLSSSSYRCRHSRVENRGGCRIDRQSDRITGRLGRRRGQ